MKEANISLEDEKKMAEELAVERKKALEDAGLDAGELASQMGATKESPFLRNISDDPSMAGLLVLYLKEGDSKIGKLGGENTIKMRGLGI